MDFVLITTIWAVLRVAANSRIICLWPLPWRRGFYLYVVLTRNCPRAMLNIDIAGQEKRGESCRGIASSHNKMKPKYCNNKHAFSNCIHQLQFQCCYFLFVTSIWALKPSISAWKCMQTECLHLLEDVIFKNLIGSCWGELPKLILLIGFFYGLYIDV